MAYILLWFPEPSQTFVLDEVNTLVRLGLDVRVYTLYGPRPPARIAGMAPGLAPVSHLGLPAAGKLFRDLMRLAPELGSRSRAIFAAGALPPLAQPGDRRRGLLGRAGGRPFGRAVASRRHPAHPCPLGRRPGHRGLGGLAA